MNLREPLSREAAKVAKESIASIKASRLRVFA
jgi:hypothetical protein